jgi:hypothetical protein
VTQNVTAAVFLHGITTIGRMSPAHFAQNATVDFKQLVLRTINGLLASNRGDGVARLCTEQDVLLLDVRPSAPMASSTRIEYAVMLHMTLDATSRSLPPSWLRITAIDSLAAELVMQSNQASPSAVGGGLVWEWSTSPQLLESANTDSSALPSWSGYDEHCGVLSVLKPGARSLTDGLQDIMQDVVIPTILEGSQVAELHASWWVAGRSLRVITG